MLVVLSCLFFFLVRRSLTDCGLQPCLSLCCEPGEVRGPGPVPHPKHRCEEDTQGIPDFYPACKPSQEPSLISEAREAFLQTFPDIREENIGGERFSCPRPADILVPARHLFGPHGLELEGNGSHRVTHTSGDLLLETRGLCLTFVDGTNNTISPGRHCQEKLRQIKTLRASFQDLQACFYKQKDIIISAKIFLAM